MTCSAMLPAWLPMRSRAFTAEEQVDDLGQQRGVLDDEGHQVPHGRRHLVGEAAVVGENIEGLVHVGPGEGIHGPLHHAAGLLAEAGDVVIDGGIRAPIPPLDAQGTLGDVLGLVAGPLQVTHHLGQGQDQAQVHRRRLAPGDDIEDVLVHVELEVVDLALAMDDLMGRIWVPLDHRRHGVGDLLDHPLAHLQHQAA